MHRVLAQALALLPLILLPVSARAAPDFEALKARAERLESLGAFLKSYVGSCRGDVYERRECKRNVKAARRRWAGKLLHVRLADRHGRLVQVVRELPSGDLRLALTPFFDEAGYGLCRGRAPHFDRAGNPRVALLPFTLRLPEGLSRRSLELQLRSGNVSLEILFKAKRAWRVPRKGESAAEGVSARLVGLRLKSARTGEVIGEVLW
jgi:hypothetical protein